MGWSLLALTRQKLNPDVLQDTMKRAQHIYKWLGIALLCVGVVQCIRWQRGGVGILPAFGGHVFPALVLLAMGWHAQVKPLRWWAHVLAVIMLLIYPCSIYLLGTTVQGTGARSPDDRWQAWAHCETRLGITGRPHYLSVLQVIDRQGKSCQKATIGTEEWLAWTALWTPESTVVTFSTSNNTGSVANQWKMRVAEQPDGAVTQESAESADP